MKKILLMAAIAFCFAACGNSNSNSEGAVETKAAEHQCSGDHKCSGEHKHEGEHKCNHAADSTKHECNHAAADSTKHECGNHAEGEACDKPADQQCDKCKEAAKKAAEQK